MGITWDKRNIKKEEKSFFVLDDCEMKRTHNHLRNIARILSNYSFSRPNARLQTFNGFIASSLCAPKILEHADDVRKFLDRVACLCWLSYKCMSRHVPLSTVGPQGNISYNNHQSIHSRELHPELKQKGKKSSSSPEIRKF